MIAVGSNIGRNNAISFSFTNKRLWLGAHKKQGSTRFTWDDGSAWSYTNWVPGEPNDVNGQEKCIVTNWDDWKVYRNLPTWNDTPCSFKNEFVCQRPSN